LTESIVPFTGVEKKDGVTSYYVDGLLHREDGPAKVVWKLCNDTSGNHTKEESWYQHGKLHRHDYPQLEGSGPAHIITYYQQHIIVAIRETYYCDGMHTRSCGPASTHYEIKDGEKRITAEFYRDTNHHGNWDKEMIENDPEAYIDQWRRDEDKDKRAREERLAKAKKGE